MSTEPFLSGVKIRNYKSIGKCDVSLGRLIVVVGRNGSGKSNFLDALRFIVDGLETSLEHAIKSRGGIDEVRRRNTGHLHNFRIEVTMNLADIQVARYGFELSSQKKGGFVVKNEKLVISHGSGRKKDCFQVENGEVKDTTVDNMPKSAEDRLYLVTAFGLPQFEAAYDALYGMGFYNLSPEQMKEVESPDAGELLRRDGSNIASVVARITDDEPKLKDRIKEYLAAIVPDITDIERVQLGHKETLQFRNM
jgi:predicted ATPase